MHTPFDLYLHLSQLILIHDTHILKNQWEFKRSNIFLKKKNNKENQNQKTNILPIPPHLKHNIVLNVEIKAKEQKRMTENKLKCEKKIKDKEKESKSDFFVCWVASQ